MTGRPVGQPGMGGLIAGIKRGLNVRSTSCSKTLLLRIRIHPHLFYLI